MIEKYLYYLAGIPIVDAPFRMKCSPTDTLRLPFYCPFHKRFDHISEIMGGYEFIKFMEKPCERGNGIFYTMEGLRNHCVKVGDFQHHIFHSYLLSMH